MASKNAKSGGKPAAASGIQSAGLTAQGVDVKWSRDTWAKTEIKLNDFDMLVLKNLVNAVTNQKDIDATFTVMGDYLYQAVRPVLNSGKVKLIDAIDPKVGELSISANNNRNKKGGRKGGGGNKSKKGPSMKDQIRMQNSVGTLNTKIESALQVFLDQGEAFQKPKLLAEKIVELRGIGFMCCAWYLLSNRKTLHWDEQLTSLTYSIIVSLERFIRAASKLKGKSHLDSLKDDNVAPTLITDLSEKLKLLKEKFKFSGETLYLHAPQLLVFSPFDTALPISSVKPYPHQTRICDIVEQNTSNGCYIMYRAVTNAGKTTTIVSLAATVQKIRSGRASDDPLSKLTIIFCCNSNPVKDQAGQWLYNSSSITSIEKLPFAIAFVKPDKEGKEMMNIRNSFMCKERPDDRLVILCSPIVAKRLLREQRHKTPFILFHDEPTIGAEKVDSENIKANVSLMTEPPKWTIVSSATLPSEEELQPFLKRYKRTFPEAHVENVSSATINIGCDVYSHDGATFLPHTGCETQADLTKCVSSIENNLFLSRTYTPLSVSELCGHANQNGSINVPKIGDHFDNIDNLSADSVRKFGLQILREVSKTDDEIVNSICSRPINCLGRKVNLTKLGTTDAHQFSQMSLIASHDPVNFALEAFSELLNEIKEGKQYTTERLVDQYWKAHEQWSGELEKLRKRKAKPASSSKRRNSDGEVENTDDVEGGEKEIELLANKPFLSFPEYYQINTNLHAKKYAPGGKVSVPRFPLPDYAFLTDEKKAANVSNDISLLLCCGVGIYAPEDISVKNAAYLETVITLAQKGRLAYLVADENIAYGVNFPFSRTIVCEDFSDAHSMNTVFQLMSRAGRVGQSWFAESFVTDRVVSTLREYSHTDTSPDDGLEIKNMVAVARDIIQREIEEKKTREIEEKNIREALALPPS